MCSKALIRTALDMDNETCKYRDVCFSGDTKLYKGFSEGGAAVGVGEIAEFMRGVGYLFYVVSPNETSYERFEDVPNYHREAWPYFLMFMLLENAILWVERRPTYRLNDSVTSFSNGLLQETGRLVFRGAESWAYLYVYDNLRLAELPWDSPLTWCLAALGVDFCYYWVHRACHEVHILWAQHHVHHSSEEFNLPVGLRQSVLQGWCGFIFYLPLALAVPPAHFIAHQHLNILYQFWIHTEVIKSLGPLEYVFNTPSHHRVHHGCTLYCLDKNYGGFLIIWDRIFGTFQPEKEDEGIVYGLVVNQPSFNPVKLQTFYTAYVFSRTKQMDEWGDKLRALFYGPSWLPGRPRLGLDEDKIVVKWREKYDVELPLWKKGYVLLHFLVVLFAFRQLVDEGAPLAAAFVAASLAGVGLTLDGRPSAPSFELCRCLLSSFVAHVIFPCRALLLCSRALFACSLLLWTGALLPVKRGRGVPLH